MEIRWHPSSDKANLPEDSVDRRRLKSFAEKLLTAQKGGDGDGRDLMEKIV